jgi:predicted dinucleotide-binding enzyme
MTTAIIGTGGIGSVIARQLASGGETLRLSSADIKSARTLAAEIGRAARDDRGHSHRGAAGHQSLPASQPRRFLIEKLTLITSH